MRRKDIFCTFIATLFSLVLVTCSYASVTADELSKFDDLSLNDPNQVILETTDLLAKEQSIVIQIKLLTARGWAKLNIGDYTEAESDAKKAFNLSLQYALPAHQSGPLILLGVQESRSGLKATAIQKFEQALELATKAVNIEQQVKAISQIAIVYGGLQQYQAAADMFRKGIDLSEEHTLPFSHFELNLAITYERMGNIEEAEKRYRELLKDQATQGSYDNSDAGIIKLNLGQLLLRKGQLIESDRLLRSAIFTFTKQNNIHYIGISKVIFSDLLRLQGKYTESYKLATEVLAQANELDAQELVRDSFESMHKTLEATGDYQRALSDFKNFVAAKNFILNEQSQNQLNLLSARLDAKDKLLAVEASKKTIEQQQLIAEHQEERLFTLALIILVLIICSYITIVNISKQQAAVSRANKELESTLAELVNTQDKLVEAKRIAALSEMVAGVAHELNTPLGIATTAIGVLEKTLAQTADSLNNKSLKPSQLQRHINTLSDATKLIETELLASSKLVDDYKKLTINTEVSVREAFLLSEVVHNVWKMISFQHHSAKNHRLDVTFDDLKLISFKKVYENIFEEVLLNIVTHGFVENEHGIVKVSFATSADSLTIDIENNGQRIEVDILDKIFNPFVTTVRRKGNTGLGLTVVYGLVVNKLSGQVNISSTTESTVLSIIVPLAERL